MTVRLHIGMPGITSHGQMNTFEKMQQVQNATKSTWLTLDPVGLIVSTSTVSAKDEVIHVYGKCGKSEPCKEKTTSGHETADNP